LIDIGGSMLVYWDKERLFYLDINETESVVLLALTSTINAIFELNNNSFLISTTNFLISTTTTTTTHSLMYY